MSNAPVFMRANYGDLFGSSMLPVLEELFRSELEMHPSRRNELFKVVSTDRDIWQSSEIHDMPLFEEIAEGTEYSFSRPKAGANKTITPKKYGLGFSISEEAVDDGKFDFIADAVRKMAKSARESQEISAMNVINNGFSATTTADGLSLFNTAHTLPSGLTFRNRASSEVDLAVSSLDAALADFETQFIGDSGIIYRLQPKVLLVAPTSKRYAMELIGSDLKADTPNNNMNSLKGEGLRVVSSPHLTDSDAWMLLADPADTGLRIVSRKGIETKAAGADVGFNNDSILYKSRYREEIAAVHAYGVWGTTGN
jgi:phage major head subunit gpT-like protein